MFRKLAIKQADNSLVSGDLAAIGQVANDFASAGTFEAYRARKSDNTIRQQSAALALFGQFLRTTGAAVGDLENSPEAWRGVTWGLVAAFQGWMLGQGYSLASVNSRMSSIKVYSRLAFTAGTLDPTQFALIKAIEGYSRKEYKRVDEKRTAAGIATRAGSKKAAPARITKQQADALKRQETPGNISKMTPEQAAALKLQSERNALIMCLLIDHGLRCGELVGLKVENLDLKAGELRFYRAKVDKWQTHKLTSDTLRAALEYLKDTPGPGALFPGSGKTGMLSTRTVNLLVGVLGRSVGLDNLSPHDLRHYWATKEARRGTPINRLMTAGGWNSLAMPLRYIEESEIANEGMDL